jgi:lauroyl/myristoyl acyltransferase
MTQQEYVTRKQELIHQSSSRFNLTKDDKLNRTLNFVSANFLNFIPSLPIEEHEDAFKKIFVHQSLSVLDEQHIDVLDKNVEIEGMDNEGLEYLRNNPAIICTFHMGSSRLLNHYLAKNGVNLTLVLSDFSMKANGGFFNKMYEGYKKLSGFKEDRISIISVDEPNAVRKMLGELKNGRKLLIYIDGNSGSGNKNIQNENSCEIDFLEESIYARAGVAYLSYLAQVPIVEAVSYRKNWEDIVLKFNKFIEPNRNVDRETYFQTTTEGIYKRFSEVLRQHPEQWEGWLNLHEVINPKAFKNTASVINNKAELSEKQLILNKYNFGVFNIDDDHFLFDKKKYNSFKINRNIYKKLFNSHIEPIDRNSFGEDNFFNQLLNNGVLTN